MDFSQLADGTARSPLGRHLDWHCVSVAEDEAVFRMPFHEHNVTVGDMVHGGAIAALADAVATAACWATDRLTPDSRGTTIALNVNFLNAARGCELVASARVIQRGGSICVAEVLVRDAEDTPVARATATYKLSHGRPSS
jgi:uncharacterized protein (TIGR00369 family)